MNVSQCYGKLSHVTDYFQSLSLFLARLVLAYGFYEPAVNKWKT